MLFVHLIYVLANYIDVLVLLAEKVQTFFSPTLLNLSKVKKTDDDPSTRFRKSRVSISVSGSSCGFLLHVLLLPVFCCPNSVSKTSMKVRTRACWCPELLRGSILAPTEGAPPHYLHQHMRRLTLWGISSDMSKSAAFSTVFALQLSPLLTVVPGDRGGDRVVIRWGVARSFCPAVSSQWAQAAVTCDIGPVFPPPPHGSLRPPRMAAYPFRHHLAHSYLCQIDVPVRVVATWSCCRCALQHFCHIAPFSLPLSVLSSPRCCRRRLRDPVGFLHMQLMWPFRQGAIHLPNVLIGGVWMMLPFPPLLGYVCKQAMFYPCLVRWLLLLNWGATGNFTSLWGNFKRRGTSKDPSICKKCAKFIFKVNNINDFCNKATVKHARETLVLDYL